MDTKTETETGNNLIYSNLGYSDVRLISEECKDLGGLKCINENSTYTKRTAAAAAAATAAATLRYCYVAAVELTKWWPWWYAPLLLLCAGGGGGGVMGVAERDLCLRLSVGVDVDEVVAIVVTMVGEAAECTVPLLLPGRECGWGRACECFCKGWAAAPPGLFGERLKARGSGVGGRIWVSGRWVKCAP